MPLAPLQTAVCLTRVAAGQEVLMIVDQPLLRKPTNQTHRQRSASSKSTKLPGTLPYPLVGHTGDASGQSQKILLRAATAI